MQVDNRKAIFGWSMYDWANSAFATTVMAGFFPLFFKDFWSVGVEKTVSSFYLGLANSAASIVVALSAPVLGAVADRGSAKKKFLLLFAFLGVVMTTALFLVAQGHWIAASLLYVLACIGFSGGNIFYDSLITAVASERRVDFVSALGYSLGYLGGGSLFALNVWMVRSPATFGFAEMSQAVRFSFLTVGLWWAVFSLPIFLFVREPGSVAEGSRRQMIREGISQFKATFHEIRHLKTIMLFLAAYWLYIDGVDTIIRMAVAYGKDLGFGSSDLILALLLVQFVGFPAALAFGYLGGKIGARRAIFIAIAVYLGICLWGAGMKTLTDFYLLAVFIALVQGGIQALSRSYYSRLIPASRSAEFFGFYNMLGKFAAVIGPTLMGTVGVLVGALGFSEDTAARAGLSSIAILFAAGGVLLYFVDEKKGRAEAEILGRAADIPEPPAG